MVWIHVPQEYKKHSYEKNEKELFPLMHIYIPFSTYPRDSNSIVLKFEVYKAKILGRI